MTIPMLETRRSKYQLVGDRVRGQPGTLLDVGARDRILRPHLPAAGLRYLSADFGPGHDFHWDLEQPLPAADDAYEFVAALDVLEHVEHFQAAYHELLRITRQRLFVSLPNLTHLSHRLRFFFTGRMGEKYRLPPEHPGDRHRWLTHYADLVTFMEYQARTAGVTVRQFNWIPGYAPLDRLISYLPLPPGLKAYTLLFEITKAGRA
jgi:hypothetical protein